MISCICVTCARVRHLEHALADFLAQDYQGPKELVIFNSCPDQTLVFAHPDVKVVNLKSRPKSLGDARNSAITISAGTKLVIWDDDDAHLPHHLTMVDKAFSEQRPDRSPPLDPKRMGCEWIWFDKQFWGWGDTIKEITQGQCPCFAFTRKAWEAVGGYPEMSVGEDRDLISKITQKFPGNRVKVEGMPSFVYRWSQGVYHMSGLGDDIQGRQPAYDRYWANALVRISAGNEPHGTITLNPKQPVNWPALAREHMDRLLKKNSVNSVCIVQLGRFGDIVNILPIALHIHNTYGKPHMMVSKKFAPLLEGVSYVEPCVVDLVNDHVNEAIELARKSFQHVIVTQIWGKNWNQDRKTPAFNMESWRAAGLLSRFNNPAMRPIFDRRDSEREAALLAKATATGKPLFLVNVTSSTSSPFEQGPAVLEQLRTWYGIRYEIIDLAVLKLHRIYDVIALMEKAAVLVSIDTALLHLAPACGVPLVALINPAPWLGSRVRMYCQTLTYTEAAAPDRSKLRQCVDTALALKNPGSFVNNGSVAVAPQRKIFHVYEQHREPLPSEANRKGVAQSSWRALYQQGVIPVPYGEPYKRDASSFGERRRLPFLKDCLQAALDRAAAHDIIFFTNDDNWLHPDLPEALRFHVSLYDCCSSQRCEFRSRPMPPPTASVAEFASTGQPHMGRDLFAFTAKWLRDRWKHIPDFVLGASEFDLCIASIIRLHFQIKSDRRNLEQCIFPAELPRGYVSHQFHPPLWNMPNYCNTAPAQLYNRRLFKDWALENAPHLKFDKHGCI